MLFPGGTGEVDKLKKSLFVILEGQIHMMVDFDDLGLPRGSLGALGSVLGGPGSSRVGFGRARGGPEGKGTAFGGSKEGSGNQL